MYTDRSAVRSVGQSYSGSVVADLAWAVCGVIIAIPSLRNSSSSAIFIESAIAA